MAGTGNLCACAYWKHDATSLTRAWNSSPIGSHRDQCHALHFHRSFAYKQRKHIGLLLKLVLACFNSQSQLIHTFGLTPWAVLGLGRSRRVVVLFWFIYSFIYLYSFWPSTAAAAETKQSHVVYETMSGGNHVLQNTYIHGDTCPNTSHGSAQVLKTNYNGPKSGHEWLTGWL